jgi:hypothetical protein
VIARSCARAWSKAARCSEAGKEVAGIELNDFFSIAASHGIEESRAIDVQVSDERQDVAAGDQWPLAESLANVPEGLAEGVLGGLRLDVTPEEVDEVLAGDGAFGRTREVGDERERLAEVEEGDGGAGIGIAGRGGVGRAVGVRRDLCPQRRRAERHESEPRVG